MPETLVLVAAVWAVTLLSMAAGYFAYAFASAPTATATEPESEAWEETDG